MAQLAPGLEAEHEFSVEGSLACARAAVLLRSSDTFIGDATGATRADTWATAVRRQAARRP